MQIKFLGQGFEATSPNAVGNHLIRFLNDTNFHSFTGISAFASEAGIFGLSRHIINAKHNFQAPRNITLIVGIDQQGTSKEALKELCNLQVSSYVFFQSEAPIFHPKIYLFEGHQVTKLIVGSSNLTGTGLFVNVEGSILIEFDNNDHDGSNLLNELKSYYHTLFDLSDQNLFPISDAVIADFVAKGIVPDEFTRRRNFNSKARGTIQQTQGNQNRINIPRRATASIPSTFQRKPNATNTLTPASAAITILPFSVPQTSITSPTPNRILVWQKPSLSASDAQRRPVTSKPTANLKLTQANFELNNILIDQKTYFRNQVFHNLTWGQPRTNDNTYEEVICPFDITILGNRIGSHNLKLSHKPSRAANQGNVPTWLHWGNTVKPFLQQYDVRGKTLKLYTDGQNFSIEIV